MEPNRSSTTSANALGKAKGWRCLEEWEGDPAIQALLHREFMVPPDPADEEAGLRRRSFLKLIGGTLGLAGLHAVLGCTVKPRGQIVPYVNQPEEIVPGKPLYYATALEFAGYGRGVLVETHEGRPTKVEGNPDHPASLGATSIFEQAAILDLYNPARSQAVMREGEIAAWESFNGVLQTAISKLPAGGRGLHFLTGRITSPTIAALWAEIHRRYPEAVWHVDEPADLAARTPRLHLDKANWVISLGSDFLTELPDSIRYARDFVRSKDRRLVVLESLPSATGTFADERLPVSPQQMIAYAAALARQWGVAVEGPPPPPEVEAWAAAVAKALGQGENGVVIAGGDQPEVMHRLADGINRQLQARERGILGPRYPGEIPGQGSLADLVQAMHDGEVEILVMLGGNRAVTTPGSLNFAGALQAVPLSIHTDLYYDETAKLATWHLPLTHPFESWGDTRAYDGTPSIIQPLIEPLYGGRSFLEVLALFLTPSPRSTLEMLRSTWVDSGRLNEAAWRKALHDGVVADAALPLPAEAEQPAPERIVLPDAAGPSEWTLLFRPDTALWDGRYAQNAWLQELPRPVHKLSWENAFLVSPESAARAGWRDGTIIRVSVAHAAIVEGKVLVQPGVAPGVLGITLGGGLWAGKERLGVNAYPLRHHQALWQTAARAEAVGQGTRPLTTQKHFLVEGRDLLRYGTEAELRERYPVHHKEPTLYNLTTSMTDGVAWGMSVDLSRCIACNACVVACQAENNVPPVGASEVARGREMYWLRIDTYYFGSPERPFIANQPVACMHCETAPCEVVCPVEATLHDHQGLNLQVYNRCIGTRYCSNNCPYKVRRFNFFRYAEELAKEPLQLMANPDVTIRARGVMEKCTYCVQRISAARIRSQVENRPIRDGEVVPACVQVCPTEAFVFGNLSDPESRVTKARRSPLTYGLLDDLGTHPRTTYLARVTNPITGGNTE